MNEHAVFYGTYDLDETLQSEEAMSLVVRAISANVNTRNLAYLLVKLCNDDDEMIKVRALNLLSSLSLPQLQSYLETAEDHNLLSFGRRPKRCLTRWFEEHSPLEILSSGLTYTTHSWNLHRLISMLHLNPSHFSRDMAYVFAKIAHKNDAGAGVSAELVAYEYSPSVADIVRDVSCITLSNSVACHKKLTDPAQLYTITLAQLYNMTTGTNTVLDGLVNHSISTAMNMYISNLVLTPTKKCDMFIDVDYMTGKMLNQYLTVVLPYMNRAEVYITGVRLLLQNVKTLDDVFTKVLFTSSIIDSVNMLETKLLEFGKMSNADRRKVRAPVTFIIFEELITGIDIQKHTYNINAYNDIAPAKLIIVTQSVLRNIPFSKHMMVTKMHPTLQRTIDNFIAGVHEYDSDTSEEESAENVEESVEESIESVEESIESEEESVESEEESVESESDHVKVHVEYVSVNGSEVDVQLEECEHISEINYLNEVMQEMTFTINSYHAKTEVLDDIIDMKNEEIDMLRLKLSKLATHNCELVDTVEHATSELNRLTEKFDNDSNNSQELINTVELLTTELDRITLEKDRFEEKWEQAVLETKECQADIEHLDNIICQQREKLNKMDQLYEEQRVKMNSIAVESQSKMSERVRFLEAACLKESIKAQKLAEELTEAQTIITDVCAENDKMSAQIRILSADLQATNNVLGTVSDMNGRLKLKLDATIADKSDMETEITRVRLSSHNANKEVHMVRVEYDELCNKFNIQQAEYNALLKRAKLFENDYLLMLTTQQQLNYSRSTKSLRLIQNDIATIHAELASASLFSRNQLEITLDKLNKLAAEINTGTPIEYVSCLLFERDELNNFYAANEDTLACVDLSMHGVWYQYSANQWNLIPYTAVHAMFTKFTRTTDMTFLTSLLVQLKTRFFKTDFILDRDLTLIGFTNGVYDLSTHSFRTGVPSDRISNVITFDYIDNPDLTPLQEFFNEKYVKHTSEYELETYLTCMAGWLECEVKTEMNEIFLMPSNLTSTVVYRLIRIIRLVFGDPLLSVNLKQAFVWKLLNTYHPLYLEQIAEQDWQECKIYEPICLDNIADAYINYEELTLINTINEEYAEKTSNTDFIEQVDLRRRWW